MERQFRFARNPQLISDTYSSGLADALSYSAARPPAEPKERGSAQVIPFEMARKKAQDSVPARSRG